MFTWCLAGFTPSYLWGECPLYRSDSHGTSSASRTNECYGAHGKPQPVHCHPHYVTNRAAGALVQPIVLITDHFSLDINPKLSLVFINILDIV